MWGMFMIPPVLFVRGFGLGLTSGYLYAAYGLKGILFNALIILPGAFLCCLALLLAAREGVDFSRRIAQSAKSAAGREHPAVKQYLLRFGTIIAIAFMASVLDVIMTLSFAGIFSF